MSDLIDNTNLIAEEILIEQDSLHVYDKEYWNARKKISKKLFTNNFITKITKDINIRSVLDLACGDASFR